VSQYSFHFFASILTVHLATGRPLILPVYLSAPAFNYAAIAGGYEMFCFLMYLRRGAWGREGLMLVDDGEEEQIRRSVLGGGTGKDILSAENREEGGKSKKRRKKGGKKRNNKGEKATATAAESLNTSPASSEGELGADEKPTKTRRRTKRARKSSPTSNSSTSSSDSSVRPPLKERLTTYIRSINFKQGIAETSAQYAQNMPSVLLLLPRAALCLALLFAFSSPKNTNFTFNTSTTTTSLRDPTYFRTSTGGSSLTSYARGVLIANAAWTAWRVLVLILAYLGLWVSSEQRLAGLCGPRHGWEERKLERRRRRMSGAMGEDGFFSGGAGGVSNHRDSFYPGDRMSTGYGYSGVGGGGKEKKRMSSMSGATMMSGYGMDDEEREYSGDELAWKWREKTRARVQDAFEFCLVRRNPSSFGSFGHGYGNNDPQALRWSAMHSQSPQKGVKREEGVDGQGVIDIPQEDVERVLAAAGFPKAGANISSPGKRKGLSRDLFDEPPIAPMRFDQPGPGTATSTTATAGGKENVRLERPEMAKRDSRDKIVLGGASTAMGAAEMYPFASPGSGYVSSKDSMPFPGSAAGASGVRAQESASASGRSKSGSATGTGTTESGSLEDDEEEEDDDDEEEEEDDDDEDDDDEEEEESAPRTSASMSSLGQPISPSSRYPFGTVRRPAGAGHGRTMSGVSSALSSGGGHSHSHSHSHSMSVSSSGMDASVVDSLGGPSNIAGVGAGGGHHSFVPPVPPMPVAMPMPPRHPRGGSAGVRSRTNSHVGPSPSAVPPPHISTMPVAFPSVQNSRERERADNDTRGIIIDPAVLYAMQMGEGDEEQGVHGGEVDEEEEYDVEEEREDQVGLLGIPSSARTSRSNSFSISAASISTSDNARSRSQSHSHSSRSRRSSARSRSRTRAHSSTSNANPIRERASSLGASMRSIIQGAAASASASLTSLTQMDNIMRGAIGPAAGLGGGTRSRPRSRVNSSMARLEEDVVFSPPPVQPHTPPMPSLPGPAYPVHQHTEMMQLGDVRRASGSSSSGSNGSGSRNVSGGSHASSDAYINNPLSNSVSSNNFQNPLIGRLRRELESEEGGYSSSGGSASGGSNGRGGNTHSRSGSESLSVISSVNGGGSNASANGDMNYTFGRPMSFMNPNRHSSQGQSSRLEEAEEILEELRRQSVNSVPEVINQGVADDDNDAHEQEPGHGLLQNALRGIEPAASTASLSMSFYSSPQQEETSTVAGSPPPTPTPAHMMINIRPRSVDDAASIQHTVTSEGGYLTPERTPEHSPERQGVPIPRSRVASQVHQYHADQIPVIITTATPAESNISSSPPGDISTAAASFVTAPATLLSATTSDSDALSERTVGISGSLSSGSDILPARVRRVSAQRRSDMVERPGDDMGAMGLGAYRVV